MTVRIRFARIGKNKSPFYRISVVDGRKPRNSKFLDEIGHFNPLVKKEERNKLNFNLDKEKALAWLKKGAQPSAVVKDLFTDENLWEEFTAKKKNSKPNKRKSRSNPISEMVKRKEEKKRIENLRKVSEKKVKAKEEETAKTDDSSSKTETGQITEETPIKNQETTVSEETKS